MMEATGTRSRNDWGKIYCRDRTTMGVELISNVFCCRDAVSINFAMARPPPPPERFSNDTLATSPDFIIASPIPRAVPSHPPPGPAGMSVLQTKRWRRFADGQLRYAKEQQQSKSFYHLIWVHTQLSHPVKACRSVASTVAPPQIRIPGGASRYPLMSKATSSFSRIPVSFLMIARC